MTVTSRQGGALSECPRRPLTRELHGSPVPTPLPRWPLSMPLQLQGREQAAYARNFQVEAGRAAAQAGDSTRGARKPEPQVKPALDMRLPAPPKGARRRGRAEPARLRASQTRARGCACVRQTGRQTDRHTEGPNPRQLIFFFPEQQMAWCGGRGLRETLGEPLGREGRGRSTFLGTDKASWALPYS